MTTHLAQSGSNLGIIRGLGDLGLETVATGDAPDLIGGLVSVVVGVLTIIATIFLLIQIITGAIAWMGAGGDKQAIENARKKIMNGIIGIVIIVSAIFLLDLIGQLLGLDYIMDPGAAIENITRL